MNRNLAAYPIKPPPSVDQLITDDGEPMESELHREQMQLLIESLKLAWQGRDDFYVAGNMGLYFSQTQAKNNDFRAPDFFVVLNTTRRVRKAWVVWEEEGHTPDVVIELLSPSTEDVDRGTKKRIYERLLKVSEYFLYDPESGALEGYQLDPPRGQYVKKKADARGWLQCERLGLWLAKRRCTLYQREEEWLHFFDAQGDPLMHPAELVERAQARAEAEKERAEAAEQRIAELLAKAHAAGVEL